MKNSSEERNRTMLKCKQTKIILILLAIFAAATVIAAESGSLNYVLLFDFSFKGVQLQKGLYNVEWEVEGQDAKMIFKPAGKADGITINGKVEQAPNEYAADNIIYKKDSNGQRIISQFEIGGKKIRIVFK
jgi:hypothetical protein